jgi:6-phosphofructokinase 2
VTVDVVTLTLNPALDVTAEVEQLVPFRKLRAQLSAHQPGGGGINVSRVLHRFGVATRAVFPVGGLSGSRVIADLAREGIAMEAHETQAETRQSITVWVRSTREHYRIVVDGEPLAEATWRACVEAVAAGPQARFVVLSGSLPPGVPTAVVVETAAAARKLGALFVCDTSGEALAAAAEAGADLVKPSRRELHALLGGGGSLEQFDHEEAARELVARGARAVVVSLGAGGAFLTSVDQGEVRCVPPPLEAVSTVGAGDSLVAGIVIGLLNGDPLREALRRGVATGAATCLEHGSEVADPEAARRLLELTRSAH